MTSVKLGHVQQSQKEQEVNACRADTDSAIFRPQPTHSNRMSTITCVHAHKVVLAACSKVLQSELMHDSNRSEMLVQTSYEALSAIIDFMYTGKLVLTQDSVNAVHARCQAWHMPTAVNICEQFKKEQEQKEAMLKQTSSATQQTDTPVRRTRGRPPSSKSATKVTDNVKSSRTKVTGSVQSPRIKVTDSVQSPRTNVTSSVQSPKTNVIDSTQSSKTKVTDSVQSPKTEVTDSVRSPRTRSVSLRSVSPLPVKTAPKRRGRKTDDCTLIDDRIVGVADRGADVVEAAGSGSGVVDEGSINADVDAMGSGTCVDTTGCKAGIEGTKGSGTCVMETEPTKEEGSFGDVVERDLPDDDADDETHTEGVVVEKEKSHAYCLRPEIKRKRDPDESVTPSKTRKVCRNIVLENVLVIKGTRPKKSVHYTKTPAEIGHIQRHGFHADYLDLSLFADASEQQLKKGASAKTKSGGAKSKLKLESGAESTVVKDDSVTEKELGAGSLGLPQDGSCDVARVVEMFLKEDTYSKQPQDTAIPEEVDTKKQGDKDHNYVVAQNDNLKQKGKQHGCRTCRRCHKRFRTTLQYRSHLDKCPVALACPRKHYHCRQCDVSFAAHTDYHKHRRMHIEMSKQHKPYMCNQCDFKCRVETRLVEHMYRQHGFPLENSGFEVYVCSVSVTGSVANTISE